MFCECKNPIIHVITWSESTWGLEKGQSYKECLECLKVIEE